MSHVVALRDITLVSRRHQQEFSALALVRTGETEIGHIVKPGVVDQAEDLGGRLSYNFV